MLFNSLTFVVYFALLLALYAVLSSWTARKRLLLIASYLFYGAWNPPFVLLLWLSTVVDWFAAQKIHATAHEGKRRLWLAASCATNLGMLGFFKYGQFAMETFQDLAASAGVAWEPPPWDIVLPVGISFYTFQTLSYTLDVYFRRATPCKSGLDFALYVTFFPQLVAGPIVRATDFLPQCETPRRASLQQLLWGLFLLTVGVFQKVVLADVLLAPTANQVFGAPGPVATADAWLGAMAFSGQIFCDFAGYSTAAIGVALCFGFHLPDNFRAPLAAVGLRHFWRCWHISLSTWLRDYLYIPLGGSKSGRRRFIIATMATMLLGGLWHGPAWSFVMWGFLHGLLLLGERQLSRAFGHQTWVKSTGARLGFWLLTYVLLLITWVFFRAGSADGFETAMRTLLAMFGVIDAPAVLATVRIVEVLAVTACLMLAHRYMRNRRLDAVVSNLPQPVIGVVWGAMLFSLILAQGEGNAFIYFQF